MRPAFSDAAQLPENDSLFVTAAESAKRVFAAKRTKCAFAAKRTKCAFAAKSAKRVLALIVRLSMSCSFRRVNERHIGSARSLARREPSLQDTHALFGLVLFIRDPRIRKGDGVAARIGRVKCIRLNVRKFV
jgi:hypothetical protein